MSWQGMYCPVSCFLYVILGLLSTFLHSAYLLCLSAGGTSCVSLCDDEPSSLWGLKAFHVRNSQTWTLAFPWRLGVILGIVIVALSYQFGLTVTHFKGHAGVGWVRLQIFFVLGSVFKLLVAGNGIFFVFWGGGGGFRIKCISSC